jgi:hypothetical protein
LWAQGPLWSLYLENDMLIGTDRHYTGGLKVSRLSADQRHFSDESGLAARLSGSLPGIHQRGYLKNIGISFAQQVYTPEDVNATHLIESDRPYAGWSYLSFFYMSRNLEDFRSLALRVGMVGPSSGAEAVQTGMHKAFGSKAINGWDHQLKDELGANIHYERRHRLAQMRFNDHWYADVIPSVSLALGNVHTHLAGGAIMRLGYSHLDGFGPSLIGAGSGEPSAGLQPNGSKWSGSFFLGANYRWVGRNIFLDGNTHRESHSVDKKRFVWVHGLGFSLSYGPWQVSFLRANSSREFEGQREPGWFDSLMIARRF